AIDSRAMLEWLRTNASEASKLVDATLANAWAEAKQRLGDDPHEWAWARLHHIAFAHPLLDRVDRSNAPLRAQMSLPSFPRGGSGNTPNNTSYRQGDFAVRSGASWRMVLDVGRWDRSTMTNAPGQSGDPRSPFYGDLLEGWATDQSFPLLYSRREIRRNLAFRIRLIPAGE
ncbi:MAG: penicillin acylase family protein, partial [Pseudomonadales bacterium]